MPFELPLIFALPKVAVPREDIGSSCLSLKEEIKQFQLKEEGEVWANPIEISDTEGEFDKTLGVHTPGLIFAKIDNSS